MLAMSRPWCKQEDQFYIDSAGTAKEWVDALSSILDLLLKALAKLLLKMSKQGNQFCIERAGMAREDGWMHCPHLEFSEHAVELVKTKGSCTE